ncbi:MAG: carboxypeptidase-like regulatory domain-containing protein [Gemmatimonadaceae bacterium]
MRCVIPALWTQIHRRSVAATVLFSFSVFGCAGDPPGRLDPVEPSPFSPPPQGPGQSPEKTWLWGMVVDGAGLCIEGATVLVVKGHRAGETLAQKTPCDAWGYDGGFIFYDLTVGVEMTLQISAPGYGFDQRTVFPYAGPQMSVLFKPSSGKHP